MGLTAQQAKTLRAVETLTKDGVAPSYSEIGQVVGVNVGGVSRLLHGLRDRGLVQFAPHLARSVRIVGEMEGLEQRSTADLRALRDRINVILNGRVA